MGELAEVLTGIKKIIGMLSAMRGKNPTDYDHPEPEVPAPIVDLRKVELLRIFTEEQKWLEEQGAPVCTKLVRFPDGEVHERLPGEVIPSDAIAGVRVFPSFSQLQYCSCKHNHIERKCDRGSVDRTNARLCAEYLRIHEGVE